MTRHVVIECVYKDGLATNMFLLWRGWAQQSIEDVLNNRDRLGRVIDEAVTRMLERFRPGGSATGVAY